MLKAKIFSIITVNALISILKKKKKILVSLVLKKYYFFLFLFLSLLVNDCILMYLEIIILNIYNFLIPYEYLFIYLFLYSNLR